jgi:hypothetical protein
MTEQIAMSGRISLPVASSYAAFWGGLSVALHSISFEERGGAASGLLSLANPASQCRLNRKAPSADEGELGGGGGRRSIRH